MVHEVWLYALVSVFIVSLVSVIGIFTISIRINKLKSFLIYFVSFSAGALFGGAFLHLLPEVIEEYGFSLMIPSLMLAGIVMFFSMEKLIHWHHHHLPFGGEHVHSFALMNLIGDGFHNFLDGLIVGATYLISIPAGMATTAAVALHEVPQEIGDFGVLVHGGFSKMKALVLNFASALLAIIGAITALTLNNYVENIQYIIVPLAIGGFIYVAGSDLIPELHKHPKIKSSIFQLITFIAGILIMALFLMVE